MSDMSWLAGELDRIAGHLFQDGFVQDAALVTEAALKIKFTQTAIDAALDSLKGR
jgi:hypothetical protein